MTIEIANTNFAGAVLSDIADLQAASIGSLDPTKYQGQITSLSQSIPSAGTAGRWYYCTVAGALTDPDASGVTIQTDGFLIDTGSAWVARNAAGLTAAKTAELVNSLVNGVFSANRNLFDGDRLTANSAIRLSDGAVVGLTNYRATDYMPVAPGGTVISNKAFFGDATRGTAFYNAQLQFISSTATFSASTPVNVPANAAFMRTTLGPGFVAGDTIVVQGSTVPTAPRAFGVVDPLTDHSRGVLRTREHLPPSNLFDLDNLTTGFALTTANALQANASFAISNFMPVIPGTNIRLNITTGAGSNYGLCWYDVNKNYISGTAGALAANTNYAVPSMAAYCRFCLTLGTKVRDMMVVNADTTPSVYLPFSAGAQNKRWRNKVIGFIGDSITDGSPVQAVVSNYLNCSVGWDIATSGASMGYKATQITAGSLTNVDLVQCFLGTNDYGFNRLLGAYGDAPSPGSLPGQYNGAGTFYGDVRLLIENVLNEKPTVRLVMLTPLFRTWVPTGGSGSGITQVNQRGSTLRQYADAIIQVAESYAVPVLDLNRLSGFNQYNMATYSADGLHPNNTGYDAFLPMVCKFLESV